MQVVEQEGRLEVMKGSQEERQILEIGEAAPQSPSKQPGETEMEGKGGFQEAACKRYDPEATGGLLHFNNRYYPGLWCYPNSDYPKPRTRTSDRGPRVSADVDGPRGFISSGGAGCGSTRRGWVG